MNKLNLIIIRNALNVSIDSLQFSLGYRNLKYINHVDLVDSGLANGLCIGSYKGNIIISDPLFSSDFFGDNISDCEKMLCELFPHSEILILQLYSVIDGYGYSIIHNGERKRIKYGSHEGIYFELGESIDEEDEAVKEKDIVSDTHFGKTVVEYLLRKSLGKEQDWTNIVLSQFEYD